MLTSPGTSACPNRFSFINNELAGFTSSKARRLGLALLCAGLLLAMAACGSAASTGNPPPPTAPTLASFSPTSGVSGTLVTLTGTNFTGATSVRFNGKAAGSFAVNGATQITATVAPGSTSGKITVTTGGGTATSATDFTITGAPTISSFSPASGIAGATVTITGTGFTGATVVKFNSTAASSFTVNSDTQITATVANGTSTGKITVTTAAGSALSASNFTITNSPTITSFTPTSGVVGTSVVITGTNFTGATAVKFNATAASSFTVNSATQITASVANGTTTGQVTVTTPVGSAISSGNFTVVAAPTITAVNPGSGPVGTSVVITGTNFSGTTTVAFNGKAAASFTVNSATQITATVAAATTTGKVTVTTPAGTGTSSGNFTVTNGNATLDLSIEGLYITQATQEYPNPVVPLLQSRSAWVRVFVKANQANTATPDVKVDFTTGGTTHTLTIPATAASVPQSIDPENATASWNAAVDKTWILPSTQIVATVDPTNAVPEADETNNTFTQTPTVQTLKPWKVTLVPVQNGSSTGNVQTAPRTKTDWVDFAKRIHPVPDAIDVIVSSTMVSSVSSVTNDINVWSTILNEVTAKRSADNVTDRYYYGALHASYGSGIAGLGWIGFPAAIGWDANGSFASVFAHEEGHNFNRPHSPCGGAGSPDPNYPYPGAIIGVPGWDVFASSNNLKGSAAYTDIMGYCSPQWISDYVYVSEYNYRLGSPIGDILPDMQGISGDGLLVWGRILNGQVILEPAFRIPANSSVATPGPYTWEALDSMRHPVASVSFSAPEVADGGDDSSLQMFSFVVPMKPEVLAAMQSMHVKLGNQEMARRTITTAADFQSDIHMQDLPNRRMQIVWDADKYPVLMLRDAKTGEVRGFVRGGNAQIDAAPQEMEVRSPDDVRSGVARHSRVAE